MQRDEAAMDAIRCAWDTFSQFLETDTPPPPSEADSVLRDDDAWLAAASAFTEAKRAADSAGEALDAARTKLLDLVKSPRETGAGVSVVKLWKQVNVDYKRVPQLQGVNLDEFRGKGREEVRITMVK